MEPAEGGIVESLKNHLHNTPIEQLKQEWEESGKPYQQPAEVGKGEKEAKCPWCGRDAFWMGDDKYDCESCGEITLQAKPVQGEVTEEVKEQIRAAAEKRFAHLHRLDAKNPAKALKKVYSEGAEYGYSLAQQQIEDLKAKVKDLQAENAELRKMCSQFAYYGHIYTVTGVSPAGSLTHKELLDAWLQYQTQNDLLNNKNK